MSPVPRSGALTETPLPRLLIELYHEQFSGRVEIRKDRVEKSFLFDRGIPMFAESNLASESLGVLLMDAGKITRHDYTRLVSQVESRGPVRIRCLRRSVMRALAKTYLLADRV